MKSFLIVFLLLISSTLFSQNYVVELCKGDTIKRFYVEDINYFTTVWSVDPYTSILYQDDSQIVLLLNQEGLYNLSVYYVNENCKTDRDNAEINVVLCLDSYIYIPNAFTPNDDGLNDLFEPKVLYIKEYHLLIFNRWGEEIFESFDSKYLWDGKTKNNEGIMEGVYVYKFFYRDSQNKLKQIIGKIVLLKL